MNDDIANKIEQILQSMSPYVDITDTMDLIEEGILDSMAIFVFITSLEDVFNVEVPDDEITKDNFRTVRDIVTFVQTLM